MENLFEAKDRRRFPRFNCSHPLLFIRFKGTEIEEKEPPTRTVDLSLGGIKIRTHEAIPLSDVLEFSLAIKGKKIKCKGRVIYKAFESEGIWNVGLSFEQVDSEVFHTLAEYFQEILNR